jgi:hypothetical protein
MIIALRSLCTWAGLDKQLDRIELGVNGVGIITSSTSGPERLDGNNLTDKPGNTVGALVNIRYVKSPLVGLEFNVNYSRYVQNYTYSSNLPAGGGTTPEVDDIQADAVEYTLGWIFHTPKVLGISTFASAGAGSTDFVPTRGGGLNYKPQARFTWYYNAGVEQRVINPHFGVRAGFRQAFFLAPDFETNYLSNLKRTHNTEPYAGFYLHF